VRYLLARAGRALAGYDVCASKGALFDDSHQLSTLICRAITSLSAASKVKE
jgi:NAD(P)H dehydrogenase (quinone)